MVTVNVVDLKLHKELVKANNKFIGRLKKYLSTKNIPVKSYCDFYPPLVRFIDDGRIPELLTHHYIYLLLDNLKVKEFKAVEVKINDEAELQQMLDIDRINYSLLHEAVLSNGPLSAAATSLNKKRNSDQICPLCEGPLAGQKSKKAKIIDGKEMFEVRCHYRHYSKKCRFFALLERDEYRLFKKNILPTYKWLKKADKVQCPECKRDLYKRINTDGKAFHQCKCTLEENNSRCTYTKRLINDR